jgi:glycosyltransferase involved in cell wall biosynthesis
MPVLSPEATRSDAPQGAARPVSIGFALEYSLGHVTHAENLKRALADDPTVRPTYVDLPFDGGGAVDGGWTRLPGVRSNWSLRSSIGAYRALRGRIQDLDALFFHTQVTSLCSVGLMRRIPAVISLDATPIQFDTLGTHYGHAPSSNGAVEGLKKRLNQRALAAARGIITWSEWAKRSLVADYGVPAEKITVIPPGIDAERWDLSARRAAEADQPGRAGRVNILFVGGDFERKGGDTLLEAFRAMPTTGSAAANVHLHIVTKSENLGKDIEAGMDPRVTIYRGLTPNSECLRALYADADLFAFPTRADCLPLAVMEALAAGLPVITTDVAALPEAVTHGVNGWIVPADDRAALTDAMIRLSGDSELRRRLAVAARTTGRERFDAATNYRRLLETVKGIV